MTAWNNLLEAEAAAAEDIQARFENRKPDYSKIDVIADLAPLDSQPVFVEEVVEEVKPKGK